MIGWRVGLLALGLLLCLAVAARPLAVDEVPEPLKPWVSWVLHGEEQRHCPFLYHSADERACDWPGMLYLNLTADGGDFAQSWWVAAESWVPLPGNARHWPQAVTVDGKPGLVTLREGAPSLRLGAGQHQVEGRLQWERLPESLQLPKQTALLTLSRNGTVVPFPALDRAGRLWLAEQDTVRETREGITNTFDLRVYRRIVDDIPLQVLTHLELGVAGEPREQLIGPVLLPGSIPVALSSLLPARLEPDGRLRLQVRSGLWTVTLTARHPGPVADITATESGEPWPAEEVWVFDRRPALRLVSVEGVEPLDPRQTTLPESWRRLPAYRVKTGQTMHLAEQLRGDPQPEPNRLGLRREIWLDFDGAGYTVKDNLSGTLTKGWRLEANPPLQLGRVVVNGEPQFITRLLDSPREGVEVRHGSVTLVADSRLDESLGELPAVGWDQDLHALSAVLHLPPGWRLLAASGADRVHASGLSRWSLLDLFLVLIIAAAVAKLWGGSWGVLALATLALIYHEPAAPRQIWLHILAAVALLRVLPRGRLRQLVNGYRWLALAGLAVIALPFLVDQLRIALYPALERPGQAVADITAHPAQPRTAAPQAAAQVAREERRPPSAQETDNLPTQADSHRSKEAAVTEPAPVEQFDPKAIVQTGPGLPSWSWNTVELLWNGPVDREQSLRLYLIAPQLSSLLRWFAVLLLAALAWRVADLHYRSGRGWSIGAGTPVAWLLTIPLLLGVTGAARADLPPSALLNELKARLLAPPDCIPVCAQSPRLHLEVAPDTLRAHLQVDSLGQVAVPLPGHSDHWLPQLVLVDGRPAEGLRRDDAGRIWVPLSEGHHQLLLEGPLQRRDTVQLALPLAPHQVTASLQGWILEGLHEDGRADGPLQLSRQREKTEPPDGTSLQPAVLPPFVQVERTLQLGIEWRAQTRVTRLSPSEAAVLLEIPLLPGESVTSADVRVERGKVQVNLPPAQRQFAWQSLLDQRPDILLTAPETTRWTEVWRLDVSPIWHVEIEGIPAVHHPSQPRWLPEWRPWPGESVRVRTSRPHGVTGRTLTIDESRLRVQPGRRTTEAELSLVLRSSQGGQHRLSLPEGASLQSASINGTLQPIRQEGRTVMLPITPDRQQVQIIWRQREGMAARFTTPAVDLGTASVNAALELSIPEGRWVLLTGGPTMGPAVLIWGVLLIIVLAALGLGRTHLTPLRTRHWILLGLGLSQIPVWGALVVVAWLFALGARRNLPDAIHKSLFNGIQVGLAVLTLVALGLLFHAVEQGLLGTPAMQIAGNGSNAQALRWYQDRGGTALAQAWVISAPLALYRLLMLAWALWLAFAVIGWLRWGWTCYADGGYWRSLHLLRSGKQKGEVAAIGSP
ncbi:MAG: hypothetical protein ACFCVA_18020 [Gammaproteobacteria bacterium]